MNTVEPIRDREMLDRIYAIAYRHDMEKGDREASWQALCATGFMTSLRVSDLCRLRVGDVLNQKIIRVKAKKTGKMTRIPLSSEAQAAFRRILRGRGADEWVLQGRVRDRDTREYKPITRQRAYQIIVRICREAGIKDPVGCHTLRKTFAYNHYQVFHDEVELQRLLGHYSQRDTLRYIGVVDSDIENHMARFTATVPKARY